jgi:hypothetical protein
MRQEFPDLRRHYWRAKRLAAITGAASGVQIVPAAFSISIACQCGGAFIVSGARTTGSASCAWYDARPAAG